MYEKKQELTFETIVNTVWISTFLALILTVPSLIIFMRVYFSIGNILLGVVLGFGLHFVGLAYSEISKGLLRMMS
jgi:ABC-type transport system involved in cytochrome c biogenesis permease component